jgi:hypothetical protein
MTTTLLAITIVASSVAAAAVIALVAAYRADRRRSTARVAALRQLAGEAEPAGELPLGEIELEVPASHAATEGDRPMFDERPAASPWPRRAAAALVVAAVAAAAGYALLPTRGSEPASAGARTPAPLELLSLRHTQEKERLVVTGLVQNPRAGEPLSRIVATAFLFAADGTFLASGRAPLDFSTLAPGDESPFVVSVPVTGTVARYRIGFRGEDGRVIAHVDRRAAGTLAERGDRRNEELRRKNSEAGTSSR